MRWKEDRRIRKEADQQKKKQDEEKKNKNKGQLRTGRELFTYDPTLFVDDEEAAAEYEQEKVERIYENDEEDLEKEEAEKVEPVEETVDEN
jgi:hypothetical protein